jgi:hypothetical protein
MLLTTSLKRFVGTAKKYAISRMAFATECLILNRLFAPCLKRSPHRKLLISVSDFAAHAAALYDFKCPPSSLSQMIFDFFKLITGGSPSSRTGSRLPRA